MSTDATFDILGLGAIAVDDLLYVDRYPEAEAKIRIESSERRCGGQTGAALVAAARLGCRCAYGGLLGHDDLSMEVVRNYEREGIDVSHRADTPDATPAHSTIIVGRDDQSRTIFSKIPDQFGPHPQLPDAEIIRSSRVLLIDHHGLEGSIRAAKIARAAGREVVADFERYVGPAMGELVDLVDHLIVPVDFALQYLGQRPGQMGPAELTRRLADPGRVTAITAGTAGCWYVDKNTTTVSHVRAFKVPTVDTTGCGDVFHGAYAAELCRGGNVEERLDYASAVAAIKASRPGGGDAAPTREEVDEFLR